MAAASCVSSTGSIPFLATVASRMKTDEQSREPHNLGIGTSTSGTPDSMSTAGLPGLDQDPRRVRRIPDTCTRTYANEHSHAQMHRHVNVHTHTNMHATMQVRNGHAQHHVGSDPRTLARILINSTCAYVHMCMCM
jgi:hypothetical protein